MAPWRCAARWCRASLPARRRSATLSRLNADTGSVDTVYACRHDRLPGTIQ